MTNAPAISWETVLSNIAARAQDLDQSGAWPADNLADLRACGAMRWSIPSIYGGVGLDSLDLQKRYAQLAAVCLTTALIFTQRDAAVGFLLGAQHDSLSESEPSGYAAGSAGPRPAARILTELAADTAFATIGIAQLTTSRQHLPPAVIARRASNGFQITGTIPWVTSAQHAQWIIAGAALESFSDGKPQQILFALRVPQESVAIKPPMKFSSLTGSFTTEVALHNVFVPDIDVLSGPGPDALAGRAAVRSFALPTCVLPLGLAAGALAMATDLTKHRGPELKSPIEALQRQHDQLADEIYRVGMSPHNYPMADISPKLRADANSLAARCSLAALELAKGHGFLLESPAQRRAREALFFFVWSSPPAVVEQTLIRLAQC